MKKPNKLLTALLGLCLIVGTLALPMAAAEADMPENTIQEVQPPQAGVLRTQMDIKDAVTQGPVVIYAMAPNGTWTNAITNENGQLLTPETPSLLVGQGLSFKANWSIEDISSKDLMSGDWFTYTLPSNYFDFTATSPAPLMARNEDTGLDEEIGTFEIIAATGSDPAMVKIILNETAINKNYIHEGYVQVVGYAKQTRDESESTDGSVKIGDTELPPIIIDPIPEIGFGDMGTVEKDGWQVSNKDKITWGVNINYDIVKQVYNGDLTNPEVKQSAIFIDELPLGVVFDSQSNIDIALPIYAAGSDGKMTTTLVQGTAGWNNYTPRTDSIFTKVTQSGESWEDFQTLVKATTAPAYGIYIDAADGNRNKIIINLGDIPGTIQSPMNRAAIDTLIDGDTNLSAERKQYTKDAYDRIFSESNNTGALGYVIQLQYLDVTGGTGDYTNTAQLFWASSGEAEDENIVRFQKVEGGAVTGDRRSVTIQKKEDGTGAALEGAVFKLQKWTGSAWADYIPSDGSDAELSTNSKGEAVFGSLGDGTYKVVEVSPPTGYMGNPTFENNIDTFTIDGTEVATIYIVAYNQSELIAISGTKTWDDASNQDGKRPGSITVNLWADNVFVASTTATQAGGWTYSFTNYPKYVNGQLVTYTITEDAVPGYTTAIYGYDITNSYTPTNPGTPSTETPNNSSPKTGDSNAIQTALLLLILSFSGIVLSLRIIVGRSKNTKKNYNF